MSDIKDFDFMKEMEKFLDNNPEVRKKLQDIQGKAGALKENAMTKLGESTTEAQKVVEGYRQELEDHAREKGFIREHGEDAAGKTLIQSIDFNAVADEVARMYKSAVAKLSDKTEGNEAATETAPKTAKKEDGQV